MYDENECCKNANSGKMNRNLCTTKNAQLIRTGDKSIACYWLKFTNFKTYYFCLPSPESTLNIINRSNSDLIKYLNGDSMSMVIITMLSGMQWKAL